MAIVNSNYRARSAVGSIKLVLLAGMNSDILVIVPSVNFKNLIASGFVVNSYMVTHVEEVRYRCSVSI